MGRPLLGTMQVQYDGSGFSGWEHKDGQRTVQGAIEEAARTAFPEFATFAFHVQVRGRREGPSPRDR